PEAVPEGAVAAHVRVPASQEGGAGGGAHGMLRVAAVEACALGGEPVQVRRADQRVAVATRAVRTLLVRVEEDEVELPVVRHLTSLLHQNAALAAHAIVRPPWRQAQLQPPVGWTLCRGA